jgi:UDP-glucose 4-epimerase
MKILITGGAGFIGTNLIPQLLRAGHSVVVIDNMSHGTYVDEIHDEVLFYKVDCLDAAEIDRIVAVHKPDATFMFHGLVSIYDCHKTPQFAIQNNLIGSVNVFDALIKHGCPRVIFAETSAVYENCEMWENGFCETQSNPQTVYAVTKAALVLLAKSYANLRGLKYTALRYFNVAGAMQDYSRTVPPLFAGFALRMMGGNKPIIFGDGNRRRDFIHVDDINDFHLMCLTNDNTINMTFNLGRGESTSLYDIGKITATLLNGKGYAIHPDTIEFEHMPEINGEAFDIRADITFANTYTGWYPKRSVMEALEDTITYLEKQVKEGKIDPRKFMTDLNTSAVKIG